MPPCGDRRGSGPERRDQHLFGVGARPGAGRCRRAARRGASARQGHLRHGRRADDVRVVDLQGERARPLGRGGGACRARGCNRDRQGQPARVRLGHHEPEPALRHRRQSRHARSDCGRLERGQCGRSGGSTVLAGARDGYGRIGSGAVRLLPCRRLQAGSRHDLHAGCFPLSATFDTVAPMARSVADCTLLYSVLSGLPRPEPHLRGLVLGVVTRAPRVVPGEPVQDLPPAGWTRLARHAARLEELGARLVEVELPEPTADVVAVVQAEAARSHGALPRAAGRLRGGHARKARCGATCHASRRARRPEGDRGLAASGRCRARGRSHPVLCPRRRRARGRRTRAGRARRAAGLYATAQLPRLGCDRDR